MGLKCLCFDDIQLFHNKYNLLCSPKKKLFSQSISFYEKRDKHSTRTFRVIWYEVVTTVDKSESQQKENCFSNYNE